MVTFRPRRRRHEKKTNLQQFSALDSKKNVIQANLPSILGVSLWEALFAVIIPEAVISHRVMPGILATEELYSGQAVARRARTLGANDGPLALVCLGVAMRFRSCFHHGAF